MDNTEIKVIRDTGFGQVKRSVMRDKSLSIEAKAIYAYFCGFAGNDTKAYPLRDTIVEELGISPKRYYKYLKELQTRGIIKIQTVKTQNGLKRNIYYINDCSTNSSTEPCSQNDHIGSSQNDHVVGSQNDYIVGGQNDHIGSSQNDHVVGSQNDYIVGGQNDHIGSSQNDHIEYKQGIITKNNIYSPLDSEHLLSKKDKREIIVAYLNLKTNKNFKANSKKTVEHINARLEEGYSLKDFQKVIDNKVSDWINSPTMEIYLRPITLFNTKFESYLNQKGVSNVHKNQFSENDRDYEGIYNVGIVI